MPEALPPFICTFERYRPQRKVNVPILSIDRRRNATSRSPRDRHLRKLDPSFQMGQVFTTERESRSVSLLVHLRDARRQRCGGPLQFLPVTTPPREKFFVRLRFSARPANVPAIPSPATSALDYALYNLRLRQSATTTFRSPMPSFCFIDRESSIEEHGSRAEERAINLLTDSPPFQQLACPAQSRYVT